MHLTRICSTLSIFIACFLINGCGSKKSSSNDTPESLMAEGIVLFTKQITALESGMTADEVQAKYDTEVQAYNTRCQNIPAPSAEMQKKLFIDNMKTLRELDSRFIAAGVAARGLPRKTFVGNWKKSE